MKIKLKPLLASLVIATSFFASVSANAADVSLTQTLVLDEGSAYYGRTFGSGQFNNTFTDKWTFTISETSDLSSTFSSAARRVTLKGSKDLVITDFSLYQDPDTLALQGTNTSNASTGLDEWTIDYSGLTHTPISSYFVQVTGTVNGTLGGQYSGDMALVSAVPEPETYAMMLAGLGLMGAVARRRKAKQA